MRNLHSALKVRFPYVTSIFRIRAADRDMGTRALVGHEEKSTNVIRKLRMQLTVTLFFSLVAYTKHSRYGAEELALIQQVRRDDYVTVLLRMRNRRNVFRPQSANKDNTP
jgi:hypothetical protein